MAALIPDSPRRDSRSVQKIVYAFLGGEGLPFADVLSAERIERIIQKHGCLFGVHGVYTTAIMVWSSLSQILRDGQRSFLPSGRGANKLVFSTEQINR